MTMVSDDLNITTQQEQEAPKNGYKPKDDKKEQGIRTTWVGTRKLIDIETGEVIELEYLKKEVKHTLKGGWRRVYLENFMELLTELYPSGRKIEVIEFILNNLNSDNQLIFTQQQVIKKTGVATQTVVDTYKHLIKNNFMKKIGAVYVVNAEFVCAFGSDKKNQSLLIEYKAAKEQSLPGF